jgi:hypothetical protein
VRLTGNPQKLRHGAQMGYPGLILGAVLAAYFHDWKYLIGGVIAVPVTALLRFYECRVWGHYTPGVDEIMANLAKQGMSLPPNAVANVNEMKIRCARCYDWVDLKREAEAALMGVKLP